MNSPPKSPPNTNASLVRLIIDPPGDGEWNMAVDQALLETADATGQATMRFYQWVRPTLSLGYFQRLANRQLHAASLSCDCIRRSSGGGAILHDHEITYCLALPSHNRWSKQHNDLYHTIHAAIVELLNSSGIAAAQWEEGMPKFPPISNTEENSGELPPAEQSRPGGACEISQPSGRPCFLCFQRRTPGDIVLDGHKIGGSAQRRLKNAVLQHGSILLRQSDYSPELPGIGELSGQSLDPSQVQNRLAVAFSERLQLAPEASPLSAAERQAAERIQKKKYSDPTWLGRK